MKNVRTGKIKRLVVPAVLCAVLCAGFFVVALQPSRHLGAAPAQETKLAGGVNFSGFAPGTRVRYDALAGEGLSQSGEFVIDENGHTALPPLEVPADRPPSSVAYTITIEIDDAVTGEPLDPIKIILRLDEKTGAVSMKGVGFGRFSDFKIYKNGMPEDLKTDWSGMFSLPQVATREDLGAQDTLKLAFQNFDAASDAVPEQSPSIVEVQALLTPGVGGGPTSLGVNSYSQMPTSCPPFYSDVDHSICDEPAIDRTIEDIVEFVVTPLLMMGEQLSAVMHYWLLPVGTLFDAKLQLETQRKQQELKAEAVKDYHPSEMMCRFGSFIKSVATAEERAERNKLALNTALNIRYRNADYTSATEGYDTDMEARLDQFRRVYCDPHDNNNGLRNMCDHDGNLGAGAVGGTDQLRLNKDINYTRTLGSALTLDVDFTNTAVSPDEEDLIALSKNLYWPRAFASAIAKDIESNYQLYLQVRRHTAMQSVAHNSFISLVGERSRTIDSLAAPDYSGWAYMKAMMRELGINDENGNGSSDDEIHEILGDYPSYYAQMEVLTKKIYQSPQFYTNLYDKPANVDRINATMDAIRIMHDRDRFESSLRREMLGSLLVEQALQKFQERTNVHLFSGMKESQR